MQSVSKINDGFLKSGIIGLAAGSMLGHLIEIRFVNLNLSYSTWTNTPVWKTLVRISTSYVILLVLGSPYYLISSDVPESKLFLIMMVKSFLPVFICSLLLFAFARLLFFKTQLVNN